MTAFPSNEGYIPQTNDQQPKVPQPPQGMPQAAPQVDQREQQFADQFASVMQGRASDINDFDLTMAGIYAGDPVGMETFNLGFYEDGTPAIVINGAPVPIGMEQWATMAEMRQRTRQEVKQRVQFNDARRTAKTAVDKVVKAVPNLPSGLGELLMATADVDPQFALQQLNEVFVNNKRDGNRTQIGELAALNMKRAIDNTLGSLTQRRGKKMVPKDPNSKSPIKEMIEVDVPSAMDERIQKLRETPSRENNVTSFAISDLANMMPSPELTMMTGGGRQSVFQRMAMEGNDSSIGGSMFSKVQHLAAYGQLFPESIPLMDVPRIEEASDQSIRNFRKYLRALDMWAVRFLHYQPSTDEEINLQLSAMLGAGQATDQSDDPTLPNFNPLSATGDQKARQDGQTNGNRAKPTAPAAPAVDEASDI
jgi:hypothetical protein